MKCMIRIRTGVTPCNVHRARGKVHHDRIDRFFSIQRIQIVFSMVANRVREVDVVPLDRLE